MTAVSDRYRKLAADLTRRVEAVPADRWDSPSPCEGWTARDVVRHIVESYDGTLKRAGAALPAGPSVDDDPAGAWAGGRDAVIAALENADVAESEYDSPFGPMTFERTTDMFLCSDVLVHTWDIAKATGGDERLDQDEVRAVGERLAPIGDALRSPGAFGPALDPPADADEQTKFLAFLGRQAW